jgi:hypothetical protein
MLHVVHYLTEETLAIFIMASSFFQEKAIHIIRKQKTHWKPTYAMRRPADRNLLFRFLCTLVSALTLVDYSSYVVKMEIWNVQFNSLFP